MDYFRPDVKVGGLLLLTMVLLLVAALSVGNLGSWFEAKQHYTVLFRNANLLTEGVRVSFAGYPVGQVTEVTVRPAQERLQMHTDYPVAVNIVVRSTVPVRSDSRIEMKTDGVIGDRYIDILPGIKDPVPPDSTILGSLGGVDGLLASVGGAGSGMQELLDSLQILLTDTSRPDSIPSTLLSVQRSLDTLPLVIMPVAESIELLSQAVKEEITLVGASARTLLADINGTLAENRAGLQRLVGELNTTMDDTQRTMAAAHTLLQSDNGDVPMFLRDMRGLIEGIQQNRQMMATRLEKLLVDVDEVVVQSDRNVYVTIENLRDMSAHLEAAAELVRANPAILIWGKDDEKKDRTAPAVGAGSQPLRDRGRVGRYDRVR